jgi:hypothetical protein
VRSLLAWVMALAVVAPMAASARAAGQSCDAVATRTTWTAFLAAFNRGDYQRLDALFAHEPDFGWYSSNAPGLRRTTAAMNRETLISYFRTRHARHDRMQLLSFLDRGEGNFTYHLRRSAADYRAGSWFRLIGKGAVRCSPLGSRLIVVSLGGPGSG